MPHTIEADYETYNIESAEDGDVLIRIEGYKTNTSVRLSRADAAEIVAALQAAIGAK